MKRVWAGIIAAVCVIVAIVLVLVLNNPDKKQPAKPAADPSTPSATTSAPSAAARAPLSTLAGLGLRKFIAAHPLADKSPRQSLTSCPFGGARDGARSLDAAVAATSSAYTQAQAVVQRYRISVPYNGSVGDRGIAVSCFGLLASRTIYGLSATTNTRPVPDGKIKGLDGPVTFGDGHTYTKTNGTDLCSVYWVPPHRDYDLVVVFRTKARPTLDQCRSGFAAAGPLMLRKLAALAG